MPLKILLKGPGRLKQKLTIPVLFFIGLYFLQTDPIHSESSPDSTHADDKNGLWQLTALPARMGIRFYQFFISEQDLPACNFNPSCSAFGFESYKSTDPIQATLMTFDRLMRCNPWIYGEYPLVDNRFVDPVTDHMLWGKPERRYLNVPSGKPLNSMLPDISTSEKSTIYPRADMNFADAMALSGETELALKEYSRLSGYTFSDDIRLEAMFHGGWTLFKAERFADAAATFREAREIAAKGSPEEADSDLFEHLVNSMFEQQENRINSHEEPIWGYISAWGDIRHGKFEEASAILDSLARTCDTEIASASQSILAGIDSLEMPVSKKGWIAGSLSAFVPGLGRMYTGRYGDASFSFAVTGGTMGLTVRALRTGPWTKSAFFCSAAAGYYLGNIYGSITSARTENHRNAEAVTAALVSKAETQYILPEQIISKMLAHRLPLTETVVNGVQNDTLASVYRAEGDRHFNLGQWNKSISSYKKFIFFSPENASIDSVLFRSGRSYENAGKIEKARICFEQLLDSHPESMLAEKTRLSLARLHLRNGNGGHARLEIDEEIEFGTDPESVAEAGYLKTWVYISSHKWDGAQKWINQFRNNDQSGKTAAASRMISERLKSHQNIPQKSPRLARYLSAVVPGLGQAYSGKILNGLGAFILNGAIVYSTSNSIQSENWFDAALILGLVFHRYYAGNIYHAEKFCHEFNEARNEQFIEAISNDIRLFDPALDPMRFE